jgi:cobalt-zinc-cadmium resistance protein CzcA
MLSRLIASALTQRAVVVLVAILALGWGALSLYELRIEAFPDPTDTQVNVITLHAGQPAEEMERQVSIPLERAVNGMPGLARVRAINLFGLSFITLTFEEGVDVLVARAQTLERLRLAELPEGVQAELGSMSTPIGEIYRYTLKGNVDDPLSLRTLQDWVVRPRILRVSGVADVVSYGGLIKEIHVRPDPVNMASKGLTMADLAHAIEQASANASGGVVQRGSEQLVIRSEGLFSDARDIESVAVASREGTPLRVRDVASVEVGYTPRQGVVSRGRAPDVVEGIVLMRRGENPSTVLAALRSRIEVLHDSVLPDGVKVVPFYDRTELVDATLTTVGHNLLEGAVLVLLVLTVFLMDWRAALIVATTIPLSLATAFIYLQNRNMAANLISMGAVDFGIIVDGAVVIVEAIVHRMGHMHSQKPESVRAAIEQATKQVARPTVFSLLIIIAAYLPIFLLQRVEGRIFAPLAHTVVAALLGSLVFSVTLVPVLATFAYRKPKPARESPVLTLASRAYVPSLKFALKRPALVLGLALASLGVSAHILWNRGSEFLPELNEGALYLTFTLPENVSLREGRKIAPKINHILEQFPQVEAHLSQLGRPEDGTDPTLTSNLEFFVKLKPRETWPKETPDLGSLIASMKDALDEIPGLDVNFSQPIRDNVNENISGQFGQIAVKVFADDLVSLQQTAEDVKRTLGKVPGVADLGIVKSGEVPQLRVKPRREALGRFGLTMEAFQAFVDTALGGKSVGQLWEGERVFDVVLRLPESARESVDQIRALRVPTASGALVPLDALADVSVGYGRASINRENGQRYIGVRMNVRGRDMGSFVRDAQARVTREVHLPKGTSIMWGGEFESKERATRRLTLVMPVAILATLGLLFNAFGSLGRALLVLVHVPFALVGGALGLWAFGMPLSIAAAVGFIALVGQASLNGVLVVSSIVEHEQKGMALDDAIVSGASERLRAVLMTATLAALGLVPAAISKSMGAETQQPIAIVIVGGTLSAAVLTLLVMPVSYRVFAKLMARVTPLRKKRAQPHTKEHARPSQAPEPPPTERHAAE